MQLSPKIITFLEQTLAVEAAACSPDFIPSSARAYAARIEGERIKLFVERNLASELIQNLLSSNLIAVVFCLPEGEKAMQIKGTNIQLAPVTAEDLPRIHDYCEAFVDTVCPLGYMRPFLAAYIACDISQAIAISFTPTDVFEQTPGPLAGQLVAGSAV
jgi:hypothetical protein